MERLQNLNDNQYHKLLIFYQTQKSQTNNKYSF